jgi:hypothetical protein
VIEHLPSKHKALSSNSSTITTKKKREKKGVKTGEEQFFSKTYWRHVRWTKGQALFHRGRFTPEDGNYWKVRARQSGCSLASPFLHFLGIFLPAPGLSVSGFTE